MTTDNNQLDFDDLQKRLNELKEELLYEDIKLNELKLKGSIENITKFQSQYTQKTED